jgi:hypothetical protein
MTNGHNDLARRSILGLVTLDKSALWWHNWKGLEALALAGQVVEAAARRQRELQG